MIATGRLRRIPATMRSILGANTSYGIGCFIVLPTTMVCLGYGQQISFLTKIV